MTEPPDLSRISTNHPLFGAVLKFDRSVELVDEIGSKLTAFLAEEPFQVIRTVDSENGDTSYSLSIQKAVPHSISTLIGDALHNLRSAFDHIAAQMVLINGGNIATSAFPVYDDEALFRRKAKTRLKGAPDYAMAAVRKLQPFQGDQNKPLWIISELNNVDKHRRLVPVGAAYQALGITLKLPKEAFKHLGVEDDNRPTPRINLKPKDKQFPLQDGAVLFVAKATADGEENSSITPNFHFELCFGEGDVVDGEPIFSTLRDLLLFTRAAIGEIAGKVFPTEPVAPQEMTSKPKPPFTVQQISTSYQQRAKGSQEDT